MIVDQAPVHLVLTHAEARQLEEQLTDAIRWGYLVRHARTPRLLLAFADRLARETGTELRSVPVTRGSGGVIAAGDGGGSLSDQPDQWLSTAEAAKHAEISEGYVRELARKHEVRTSRSAGGAWRVSYESLSAWCQSRKEATREAV